MSKKSEYCDHLPTSNGNPGGAAPAGFPLLDPQETTVPPDNPSSYRTFMASGMMPDIRFNESIYEAIDRRDDKERVATFRGCRASAYFVRHRVSHEIRVASSRCRLRWCPLCIQTKRYIMTNSVMEWIRNVKKPKFITLTLKHSSAPLAHQIESIYNYFKILRRRPRWKKHIKGGVWFFQVKKSDKDGCWHPHIHLLGEGKYLSRDDLSELWMSVTGSSKIVDIQKVKNAKDTAKYVSRYATAPCRLLDLSAEDAIECVDALHGRRLCGTFGTGRVIKLNPSPCENQEDWEILESFHIVMRGRRRSDWMGLIYQAWIKDEPCYACPDPPKPPPPKFTYELEEEPVKFKQMAFEWNGQLEQSLPK